MSLKEHIKTHNKAYSLGFLAVVAAVVGYLFIQTDNLSMQGELTGALVNSRKTITRPSIGVKPPLVIPEAFQVSHGEYMTMVYNNLMAAGCTDLCPQMSTHRLEEKARCTVQALGAYNPPMPGYNWYSESTTPQEAIEVVNKVFGIATNDPRLSPNGQPLNAKTLRSWANGTLAGFAKPFCNACNNQHPVTRMDMVNKLYAKTGDTSCNSIAAGTTFDIACTDLPNNTPEACKWNFLMNKGVIGGFVNQSCQADQAITRAEFMKNAITLMDGLANYVAPTSPTYADVQRSSWYYDFVEAAVQLGWIGSMPNNEFRPSMTTLSCFADEILAKATYLPPMATTGTLAIAKTPGLNTTLTNGVNRLIGFTVTSSPVAASTLTKMDFEVISDAGVNVSNFQLLRGGSLIATSATPTFNLTNAETLSAGTSQTYYLEATVSGMVLTGSELATRLTSVISPDATVSGLPVIHMLSK